MEKYQVVVLVLAALCGWLFLVLWLEDRMKSSAKAFRLSFIVPIYFVAACVATAVFFPIISLISTRKWIEKQTEDERWREFCGHIKKSRTT